MTEREQFISENPIEVIIQNAGAMLHGSGNQKTTNVCGGHEHKKLHQCVSVDTDSGLWHCNDCGTGGSVIDFLAMRQGIDPKEFCKRNFKNNSAPQPTHPPAQSKIVTTYDYLDETGQFLYQVCRMEPKTFRQRRKVGENWVWNMEGVRRVLYNLIAVLNPKNRWIWIVEGEKDASNLMMLGLVATTNVGGAKKWMNSYAEALKGKDVVLCGDNDDPGRAHIKQVMDSLEGKVNSIRQIHIPDPHKDVSDFIASFGKTEDAGCALGALVESAPVLTGGMELPIQNMEELEAEYMEHLRMAKMRVLSLSNWLPSLGAKVRGLVPGEVVSILAGTGVGKTALIQNLAAFAAPLPTLLFELELPGSLTFERFCALAVQTPCREVEGYYSASNKLEWRESGMLNHIWTCTRSRVNPDFLEMLINKAELRMGMRPVLVLIDYIQLMGGTGAKRYEVVSDAAESLKRIAKATKTIIVVTSQIKRKDDDDKEIEVTLTDAKESGAIENSSGLVLGVWRPAPTDLCIRILKNTKGQADRKGRHVTVKFDGASMRIYEETKGDGVEYPHGSMPTDI